LTATSQQGLSWTLRLRNNQAQNPEGVTQLHLKAVILTVELLAGVAAMPLMAPAAHADTLIRHGKAYQTPGPNHPVTFACGQTTFTVENTNGFVRVIHDGNQYPAATDGVDITWDEGTPWHELDLTVDGWVHSLQGQAALQDHSATKCTAN
jgi:hypothetical protein